MIAIYGINEHLKLEEKYDMFEILNEVLEKGY